jgi:hypothetical protein
MMLSSYLLGQKYYPVPYQVKKLIAYLALSVLIYFVHLGLIQLMVDSILFSLGTGFILFALFGLFVAKIEAKELAKLPVVGKYFGG